MFVGQTGVGRILKKTAQMMKEGDPRKLGVIPIDMIQRHVNMWYALSLDLFGAKTRVTRQHFSGRVSRDETERWQNTTNIQPLGQTYAIARPTASGGIEVDDIPLRRAMNEVLRDAYIEDCQKVVKTWNRILEKEGCEQRIRLPHRRFYRHQGLYAGLRFDVDGHHLTEEQWATRQREWLPSEEDKAYIHSLMRPVVEPGKFADWIAPPPRGINGQAVSMDYVQGVNR